MEGKGVMSRRQEERRINTSAESAPYLSVTGKILSLPVTGNTHKISLPLPTCHW